MPTHSVKIVSCFMFSHPFEILMPFMQENKIRAITVSIAKEVAKQCNGNFLFSAYLR